MFYDLRQGIFKCNWGHQSTHYLFDMTGEGGPSSHMGKGGWEEDTLIHVIYPYTFLRPVSVTENSFLLVVFSYTFMH